MIASHTERSPRTGLSSPCGRLHHLLLRPCSSHQSCDLNEEMNKWTVTEDLACAVLFQISQRGKLYCFHFIDEKTRFGKARLLKVIAAVGSRTRTEHGSLYFSVNCFLTTVCYLTTYWSLTWSWALVLYIFMVIFS